MPPLSSSHSVTKLMAYRREYVCEQYWPQPKKEDQRVSGQKLRNMFERIVSSAGVKESRPKSNGEGISEIPKEES